MTTIFSVIVLTIASALWLQIAIGSTWQGPGDDPPDDNVAAPLNIGSDNQSKAGGINMGYLQVGGGAKLFQDGNALKIDSTNNGDNEFKIIEGGNIGIKGSIYDFTDDTVNIGENLAVDGNIGLTGDIEWANGELTSDDNNTGARIIARAKNNPSSDNAIFAVESSGGSAIHMIMEDFLCWEKQHSTLMVRLKSPVVRLELARS